MTNSESVSAVIPVYNGEIHVAEAIRSVLQQTAAPLECIVVDDGSIDGTASVVKQFGSSVRYELQVNAGVTAARNRGVDLARGALLAFLDHDDTWLPTKLESQLEEMQGRGASMVVCGVSVVNSAGAIIGQKRLASPDHLLEGLLTFDGTESVSCSSTGLIRRDTFEMIGRFDPLLGTSGDLDLLIRCLLSGTVGYVDEPLVRYRIHEANMSHDIAATERDMLRLYAKVFADPRLPADTHRLKRRAYAGLYRMLCGSYLERGDRLAAARTAVAATVREPSLAVRELRHRVLR